MGRKMESHPPFHRMVESMRNEAHRVRRLVLQATDGGKNVQVRREVDRQAQIRTAYLRYRNPLHEGKIPTAFVTRCAFLIT